MNIPHNTIVADPSDPNILYAGTDLGIWKTTNAGASWIHQGPAEGMPNVAVFRLRANAATDRIMAFTHGRGAFVMSPTGPTVFSSLLPTSRSVFSGSPAPPAAVAATTATVFATIINAGVATATGVTISLGSSIPVTFSAQTTDPATNQVTGSPNRPVDIPGGQSQTYVLSLVPTAPIAPTEVKFNFTSTNGGAAPALIGINTLLFSASATPVPDIVALVATSPNTGILRFPGAAGARAFAVATSNVGASGLITVSVDTGGTPNVPVALSLCQTNPLTGSCTSSIGPTVTTQINAGETPTFGIFVLATGTIPLDAAANRIFVRFKDAGAQTRGSTSVAVTTTP